MKSQLLFVFVLVLATSVANLKHYDGYQVIRTTISTKAELELLLKLQQENPSLDFWSGPEPDGADIMVTPLQRRFIMEYLSAHGITFRILINDVENLISQQKEEAAVKKGKAGFWEAYQTTDAIYEWMDALEVVFMGLISVQTIGTSTEGRPLRLLKIATNDGVDKPAIFIDGTFHAREFISPATVTWMLNELLMNTGEYQDILTGVDLYVLPISNPDGYEYAHTTERLWRKTRSLNSNSTCFGTDLNRNFNHKWGGIGTSPDPCSNNYHGASPCSEPECQAISDFITNSNARWWAYVTFHSSGQMWLTPWGFTDEYVGDHSDMMAMGIKATDALTAVHNMTYKVGPSSTTIYYTSGTSADWAKGKAAIKYSLTVELRDTGEYGHMLPPEQIIPSGQETFEAVKVLAREVIRQQKCTSFQSITLSPEYSPTGVVTVVNGMETYETGNKLSKTMLIAVYDIYGFTPSTNIWQISDKMAESGVRVAMPDFFRGEPWKREHYPYPTDEEFYNFVKATSWEESVRADMIEVLKHYKEEGVTTFGIFGFCFGGKIAALATGEFFEDIRVAAHFHPSSMNMSDAELIRSPTILLPGANDPDMTEYCQIINDNNGQGSCSYTHFTDVNHGFAGGRADWTDDLIRARAEDAVTLARDFFCEKFK